MLIAAILMCRAYKIHYIYIFVAIGLLVFIIEYKFRLNREFAEHNKQPFENIKFNNLDLVFFSSSQSDDFLEFVYFRCVNALVSSVVFGHCGIIVMRDDQPYILECVYEDDYNDANGTCIKLALAKDVMCSYEGRVHVVQNNLNHFIENSEMDIFTRNFVEKQKDKTYNGFSATTTCVGMATTFLQDLGLVYNNVVAFTVDSLLNKKQYTVPIEFEYIEMSSC